MKGRSTSKPRQQGQAPGAARVAAAPAEPLDKRLTRRRILPRAWVGWPGATAYEIQIERLWIRWPRWRYLMSGTMPKITIISKEMMDDE